MSRRRQLAGLVIAAILVAWPVGASSQARLSWQFYGGGAIPISAYVHNGVRIDTEVPAGTEEDQLFSRLVDQYNRAGFRVGTTFLINQFEIGYSFSRFTWDREETMCRGFGGVVEPLARTFDDALVDYTCADSPLSTTSLGDSSLDPLFLHVISLGYRYYFVENADRIEAYAVGAPGLGIANYNDNFASQGNLLGFNLGIGLGLNITLTTGFSVGLDARYNLLLTSPPADATQSANRAVARGNSSLQAVLDAFQYIDITLGIHVDFR
jgi:hypothetical protein